MLNLEKALFQATLGDLKELLTMVLNENVFEHDSKEKTAPKRYVYGIAGIANLFGCSVASANRIKASGEIDDAISQIGGIIVVDAEYALDLLRVSKKYRNTSLKKSQK